MSARMKDQQSRTKPRVFKLSPGGMWWADVRDASGKYHCDAFFTYPEALGQAHKYAAMVTR